MVAALLTMSLSHVAVAQSPTLHVEDPLAFSANNDLELLKEEETVSIASRYEQPISQAPSNVYVVTDEDIRQSGATDLPTVLRRIPGLEVMQMTGPDVLPVPLDVLPVLPDVLPLDASPALPDVPPLDVLPLRHDPPPFLACLAA